MKLFLDDERFPIEAHQHYLSGGLEIYLSKEWTIVRSYEEFVEHINTHGLPELINFDNDLGTEKEGYDCAKFLVVYCLEKDFDLPKWLIHSGNNVARENIQSVLNRYSKFRKNEH